MMITARQKAVINVILVEMSACLSLCLFVSLSASVYLPVCLSVILPHAGIVSKRPKL